MAKMLLKLGWREWVGLPLLGLPLIKAKVDTGARTSCLHAYDIEPFNQFGVEWIRFKVHPLQGRRKLFVSCEAPVMDRRQVTDSGGHREMRYVIAAEIALADARFIIDLTLTNRDLMRFRMLLGREAMKGRITVNPGKSFLLGKSTNQQAMQFYQ